MPRAFSPRRFIKYSILNTENNQKKNIRLAINNSVGIVIGNGLNLLGIETLQRM
ncbi:hypothetical protein FJY90_00010 [Candidatus Gottesmanbacteria bacterium]|nr:hypothetical protein [Candidatus Gottesmanbacteria bacterium]